MMDGRVDGIRKILDRNGFYNTLIMSYTAKYASSFYGPFRDALDSAPKSGDKKTYQMDYRNSTEAIKEALLDEQEGADFLMVKPGIAYLDIIKTLSENSNLPITAYQVSGEYSMIKAAAQNGWINEQEILLESLIAFRRSGASGILTYYAPLALDLLR
jgi:porphobilinogen synthase